jgi:DNA-binding response OmpR family regulator
MESKRILVVDDDEAIQQSLYEILTKAGFEVTLASDGLGTQQSIERQGLPHLMLVDLNLPDTRGLALCQQLFEQVGLPIIVITGFRNFSAAESLEFADDFVRKPFDHDELVMRVRRVLSRIVDFSYANSPTIKISDRLSVDLANQTVLVEGERRRLTPTENAILSILLKYRGQVVDADTLVARIWHSDISAIDDRDSLRVHIHRLRQKIEPDPNTPQIIVTERGVGYCFTT